MKKIISSFLLMLFLAIPLVADAAGGVGIIIALKGNAIIKRGSEMISAKVKDDIYVNDTVTAVEFSRVKIKFTDDSVLTLYPNSSLNVREYMYRNDGKKGRSVYKLIDGKLKSLVGKTSLEVHTPTSVAAARGTHFFLQLTENDCLLAVFEGVVGFRRKTDDVSRERLVSRGMYSFIKVKDEKPQAPSEPVKMPKGMVKDLLSCKIVEPD